MHGTIIGSEEENGTLFDAVRRGRFRQAKLLLEAGVDPNQRTATKESPLMYAIIYIANAENRRRTLKLLMEFGADPNLQEERGQTALIQACILHQLDTAVFLLEQPQILPNLKDSEGNTALMYAAAFGFLDIVETFLEMCKQLQIFVRFNTTNDRGKNALTLAVENGNHEIAKFIWNEIQRYQVFIEKLSLQEKYEMGLMSDDEDIALEDLAPTASAAPIVSTGTNKSRPKSRKAPRKDRKPSEEGEHDSSPQHHGVTSVEVRKNVPNQVDESGRKTYVIEGPDVCKSCKIDENNTSCNVRHFMTSPTDDDIHKEMDQLKLSSRQLSFSWRTSTRPLPDIGQSTDDGRITIKLPPIKDAVVSKKSPRPLKLRSLESDVLNSSVDLSTMTFKRRHSNMKTSPLVNDVTEEPDETSDS